MRASPLVALVLLASGCAALLGAPPPSGDDEDDLRRCKGDISGSDVPRVVTRAPAEPPPPPEREKPSDAHPNGMIMNQRMRELFAALGPRAAPSLDGAFLVCRADIKHAKQYISTIPILPFSIATMDLHPLVQIDASLGGERPAEHVERLESEVYFTQIARLGASDKVAFKAVVDDVKRKLIGAVSGPFGGALPVVLDSQDLRVECRGLLRDDHAALTQRTQRTFEDQLRSFNANTEQSATWEQLADTLARLALLTGEDDPRVKSAGERMGKALADRINKRIDEVDARVRAAPAPGTWVTLDDTLEARVIGALCQKGRIIPSVCAVGLEVRVRKGNPRLCPVEMERFGTIRGFDSYVAEGRSWGLSISSVSRPAPEGIGPYVLHQEDLMRANPGDSFVLELMVHGILASDDGTARNWKVPLIEVKLADGTSRFFRVY